MSRLLSLMLICSTFALIGCGTGEDQSATNTSTSSTQVEDSPGEWVTTDSGLKYRILREGNGKKPTKANSVTVHYEGTLDSGEIFDSSYTRGATATFPLTQVIAGWTEGLTYVDEGGKIELEIPPQLGYGNNRAGSIPPNSTLHFKVELVRIQ
ncbi:MAG: FKBP-type peptidyl-prolyl cis-trans isomerase [Planctomycetaceae bacterium]|nr:FKBP-type peptidyl-prolyl cis-trans isomerase [Planctomycetaceae bacterium]